MNISKISRSIVVVIFVVFIIFLSFLNVSNILNKGDDVTVPVTSTLVKVGFVFAVIFLVGIYMYIKDKLYKKHVKRNLSFIYRYIYIISVLLGASIFSSKNMINQMSDSKMVFHVIVTMITGLLIKKIIFNVSKSDMLSVFGMFTCTLFPLINVESKVYIFSMILSILLLSSVYIFQLLIDELKQKGIKTKKYIIETILLGIFAGISTIFGINVLTWTIIIVLTLFVTYNLDNTHINFPKKFMASLTQSKRESLYKIERININKIIIVICISIIILFLVNIVFSTIIVKMNNNSSIKILIEQIESNKLNNVNKDVKVIVHTFLINSKAFVTCSPMFYLVIFIYILFMEILAFCLRRRYDTKTTIMKIILLALFVTISIFNLNIYYFQPILTILLVLIAIVNTSNIYLNREERIKMLVA